MTEQMFKRVQLVQAGEPLAPGTLQLQQVPKPTKVGENEVLLKMKAAPINPSDLLRVRGAFAGYSGPVGDEGLGIVEQVGTGVTDLKVGQRVAYYSAGAQQGSWGEYVVLNTKVCPLYYVVPDQLSDEEACQLVLNPLTLIGMLREFNLKQGDWVLQTAAAGALGKQLIQYAKLKGYRTINVVRREEQIAELKALGADEVLLLNDQLKDNVKKIEPNLKWAVDAVSGRTAGQIASILSDGGLLLVYGLLSSKEIILPFMSMLFADVAVKVYVVGKWIKDPEQAKKALDEYVELLLSRKLRHSAKTFRLNDYAAAIQYQEAPGHNDKAVLLF